MNHDAKYLAFREEQVIADSTATPAVRKFHDALHERHMAWCAYRENENHVNRKNREIADQNFSLACKEFRDEYNQLQQNKGKN